MKTYIGTKIISAEPSTNEDGELGYKVIYQDGYTSWSPKEVFEEAYRTIEIDRSLTDNLITDMFSKANKEFGQFVPQQYVWIFLKLCEKNKITFIK